MDIEKPNCIGCHHIHPDNGNCTAVGGFCTAVPAANCPLIPELRAENEKMRAELEQKSKLIAQQAVELERRDTLLKDQEAELEQVKRERDAAVEKIREWEKFDTYLLIHNLMPPEKWCDQKEN